MKTNQRIEIVCSTQRGVSSMSVRSRIAIRSVLAERYRDVRITIVNSLHDLEALTARRPDLVIIGMRFIAVDPVLGIHATDRIWISDYLDEQNIAYAGSSKIAHELEFNKHLAKQRIHRAGLKTSPYYVARLNHALHKADINLRYPVFIKPTNRGGGNGIDAQSVAYTFIQLRAKVRSIGALLKTDSLIEEYLPGREFSVAILRDKRSAEFSVMPIELTVGADVAGVSMLSGAVKLSDVEVVSAVLDPVLYTKVTQLALSVFNTLGARDYGRIDIRLGSDGVPNFLEANLIPSLISGYGSFPRACVINKGIDYKTMILRIAALGLARKTTVDDGIMAETSYGISQPLSGSAVLL
jgi:D-alanine-D-alanine ligase